jgi:ABC-2 type transport system ATP-binding protein
VRLAIGCVSQDLAVDDALAGYENLRLQAGFYHIPRGETAKRIDDVLEDAKMTIFLTTHYMDEADALCDRIAIIDRGSIKVLDTPAGLKSSLGSEILVFEFAKGGSEDINAALNKIRGLGFVKDVTKAGGKGYVASVTNGEASVPANLTR